jgi:general stress protein CsbA
MANSDFFSWVIVILLTINVSSYNSKVYLHYEYIKEIENRKESFWEFIFNPFSNFLLRIIIIVPWFWSSHYKLINDKRIKTIRNLVKIFWVTLILMLILVVASGSNKPFF